MKIEKTTKKITIIIIRKISGFAGDAQPDLIQTLIHLKNKIHKINYIKKMWETYRLLSQSEEEDMRKKYTERGRGYEKEI